MFIGLQITQLKLYLIYTHQISMTIYS